MSDLDDAIGEAKAYNRMGGLDENVLNDIAHDNDVTPGDLLEGLEWGRNYYKKEEHTLTLGEKLKATFDELEKAQIVGAEKQHHADMEKVRKERADIKNKLDKMRDLFVVQIEAGKVPLKKIENYDWMKWIKNAANTSRVPHEDLWHEFKNFWVKEGLAIKINDAHDGGGIKGWINVTLVIATPTPRPVFRL